MKRTATWLLYAMIPASIALRFTHVNHAIGFAVACVAVLPLASWIGSSTEQLAHRMGPTYGALFNATFGNFAEMVIAVFAIREGLVGVVRASLSGSILGNILLVTGASMFAGGWKRETLKFNMLAAESQAGQMILAVSAMVVPALFFRGAQQAHQEQLIHPVSIGVAAVLMATYVAGLWFTFRTHQNRLAPVSPAAVMDGEPWSLRRAVGLLVLSSVAMSFVAESLVDAVAQSGRAWGLNEVFLGFVVVAVVGNAAEHSTAVMLAIRGQMDTSLNIAMQSSVQVALFVTPLLVFLSYPLGHPLDLLFTPFELLAVGLGTAALAYLIIDGETNWYEGVQLIALYTIIAVALFFLPAAVSPEPVH